MNRPIIARRLLAAGLAASVLALVPAPAAHAATPLATPTGLEALHVSDTAADLFWVRDGSSAEDVLQRRVNGVWQEFARGLTGYAYLRTLTPGTTYTLRVYSIPYSGLGYSNSAPSAPITFTTLSGPDTVPPSKPPAPIFSGITTTVINVYWGEATDNVQVTGYYLQQLIGGVYTTIRAA